MSRYELTVINQPLELTITCETLEQVTVVIATCNFDWIVYDTYTGQVKTVFSMN